MRALILVAAVAVIGCGTERCKDDTLLLSLTLEGASARAVALGIEVDVGGRAMNATVVPRGASGSVEIDFPAGYPAGASGRVRVTALGAGGVIGSGDAAVQFAARCETLAIDVAATTPDADLAIARAADLGASSSADLAPDDNRADLAPPPDLAPACPAIDKAVYADAAKGTDSATCGGAAGGCACQSLTRALANGGAATTIIAAGAFGSREQFPIRLTGTQTLECDGASIAAGAGTNVADGVVQLGGSANQIIGCEISSGCYSNCAGGDVCVVGGATPGQHVITNAFIHDCAWGVQQKSATFAISGGAIFDVQMGFVTATAGNTLDSVEFKDNVGTAVSCASGGSATGCGDVNVTCDGACASCDFAGACK
jgi:hypothetical protein